MSQLLLTAVGGAVNDTVSLDLAPERAPGVGEVVISVSCSRAPATLARWLSSCPQSKTTPRERLERVYGELLELVEHGVIGAIVEATYPPDQYQKAPRHAQKNARTGKVLFIPNGPPEGALAVPVSLSSAHYVTEARA